jgi:large subunit ribosomal protein L10
MKKQMATPDFVPQGGTSPGKQRKIDAVRELTDKASRAKSIVLADYRGLKHKQLEELRRTLKKANADFTVTKNRLFAKALGDRAKSIESQLKQSTGALFAYADEVTPLGVLLKFFKTTGFGKAKGGLLGDKVLTEADVMTLSALPPRPVLLGRLAAQLNAPIQGLHYALNWNLNKLVWALNSIKEKKTN